MVTPSNSPRISAEQRLPLSRKLPPASLPPESPQPPPQSTAFSRLTQEALSPYIRSTQAAEAEERRLMSRCDLDTAPTIVVTDASATSGSSLPARLVNPRLIKVSPKSGSSGVQAKSSLPASSQLPAVIPLPAELDVTPTQLLDRSEEWKDPWELKGVSDDEKHHAPQVNQDGKPRANAEQDNSLAPILPPPLPPSRPKYNWLGNTPNSDLLKACDALDAAPDATTLPEAMQMCEQYVPASELRKLIESGKISSPKQFKLLLGSEISRRLEATHPWLGDIPTEHLATLQTLVASLEFDANGETAVQPEQLRQLPKDLRDRIPKRRFKLPEVPEIFWEPMPELRLADPIVPPQITSLDELQQLIDDEIALRSAAQDTPGTEEESGAAAEGVEAHARPRQAGAASATAASTAVPLPGPRLRARQIIMISPTNDEHRTKLRTLGEFDPTETRALLQGLNENSAAALAAHVHPQSAIQQQPIVGLIELPLGAFEGAKAWLESAENQSPNNPAINSQLAQAISDVKDLRESATPKEINAAATKALQSLAKLSAMPSAEDHEPQLQLSRCLQATIAEKLAEPTLSRRQSAAELSIPSTQAKIASTKDKLRMRAQLRQLKQHDDAIHQENQLDLAKMRQFLNELHQDPLAALNTLTEPGEPEPFPPPSPATGLIKTLAEVPLATLDAIKEELGQDPSTERLRKALETLRRLRELANDDDGIQQYCRTLDDSEPPQLRLPADLGKRELKQCVEVLADLTIPDTASAPPRIKPEVQQLRDSLGKALEQLENETQEDSKFHQGTDDQKIPPRKYKPRPEQFKQWQTQLEDFDKALESHTVATVTYRRPAIRLDRVVPSKSSEPNLKSREAQTHKQLDELQKLRERLAAIQGPGDDVVVEQQPRVESKQSKEKDKKTKGNKETKKKEKKEKKTAKDKTDEVAPPAPASAPARESEQWVDNSEEIEALVSAFNSQDRLSVLEPLIESDKGKEGIQKSLGAEAIKPFLELPADERDTAMQWLDQPSNQLPDKRINDRLKAALQMLQKLEEEAVKLPPSPDRPIDLKADEINDLLHLVADLASPKESADTTKPEMLQLLKCLRATIEKHRDALRGLGDSASKQKAESCDARLGQLEAFGRKLELPTTPAPQTKFHVRRDKLKKRKPVDVDDLDAPFGDGLIPYGRVLPGEEACGIGVQGQGINAWRAADMARQQFGPLALITVSQKSWVVTGQTPLGRAQLVGVRISTDSTVPATTVSATTASAITAPAHCIGTLTLPNRDQIRINPGSHEFAGSRGFYPWLQLPEQCVAAAIDALNYVAAALERHAFALTHNVLPTLPSLPADLLRLELSGLDHGYSSGDITTGHGPRAYTPEASYGSSISLSLVVALDVTRGTLIAVNLDATLNQFHAQPWRLKTTLALATSCLHSAAFVFPVYPLPNIAIASTIVEQASIATLDHSPKAGLCAAFEIAAGFVASGLAMSTMFTVILSPAAPIALLTLKLTLSVGTLEAIKYSCADVGHDQPWERPCESRAAELEYTDCSNCWAYGHAEPTIICVGITSDQV